MLSTRISMHTLPSRDPKRELDSENFAHASMYWHYLFFFFFKDTFWPRFPTTSYEFDSLKFIPFRNFCATKMNSSCHFHPCSLHNAVHSLFRATRINNRRRLVRWGAPLERGTPLLYISFHSRNYRTLTHRTLTFDDYLQARLSTRMTM